MPTYLIFILFFNLHFYLLYLLPYLSAHSSTLCNLYYQSIFSFRPSPLSSPLPSPPGCWLTGRGQLGRFSHRPLSDIRQGVQQSRFPSSSFRLFFYQLHSMSVFPPSLLVSSLSFSTIPGSILNLDCRSQFARNNVLHPRGGTIPHRSNKRTILQASSSITRGPESRRAGFPVGTSGRQSRHFRRVN
ncbi:hypothetical protein F4809DRAFT_4695 [Biscogniauxia mediterranea]|nr:hypothetical protein F4809DRAFT_4695 [Biscogniauxia mediterranea]